jgi:hypothetical protein
MNETSDGQLLITMDSRAARLIRHVRTDSQPVRGRGLP